MTDTLTTLSHTCGIADAYHDIWGGHHLTSTYTRQALLTAMHFPPDAVTDHPDTILHDLEARAWQQRLPPVVVVRSGEVIRVDLTLSEAESKHKWHWSITLENGDRLAGEIAPGTLPRKDEQGERSRYELELPAVELLGYHSLQLQKKGATASLSIPLIVVPQRCHQPAAIQHGGRIWGLTVQLYGVRSQRNWGIGDFTDLGKLVELTGKAGGHIVGVNPLHALFPDNPAHISPYSPSQRSFVNVLYLDVEAVPEFATCAPAQRRLASADFQARLKAVRAATLVDYVGVAKVKFEILELLFTHFLDETGKRSAAFAAWRTAQGTELENHARFEALQAHFRAANGSWGWPAWPEAYRDPHAPAVAAFAAEHAESVAYHAWLQWLADEQLSAVATRAEKNGMAAGLYQDLAVGTNPGGSESWAWQDVLAEGAHAGAPPDEINLMGQDWGLPPFVPHRLRDVAYAPLIDILRANMKHAGALRIDHVMGLMRVFWVPAGIAATEGAYVHYPFEDMLGIVALESQRNRCLVIGEDLGTVPDGFRPRLAECGVLSYHPLMFERSQDGNFRLPAEVPQQALVAAGTHDLPTLSGYWKGEDIEIRTELNLFPCEEVRQHLITERGWDRGRLLWALERENLLPPAASKEAAEIGAATVAALHAYLARSPAQIMVIQPEDIFGVIEQPNLPGTLEHQHPNWQRRLPLSIEKWASQPSFGAITGAVQAERPK
jgi:(1->4)-alpha-D-glucan 1-alpha-D-glucosylmutase